MAEPIPAASSAADAADDETSQNLPNNAEDRKAAAALNSLNANDMSQENGEAAAKQPSAADQEALGKAMSRLEIASGLVKKKSDTKKAEAKKEVEAKKKVKIAAEDVTFLVEELDLSKPKATDLLRSHDGNAMQAIKSFLTPQIRV
ncbi:hypothetical protein A1O1_01082 [Capronia coronata CBS 617.96]|uniref:Nascent polypeptide-associated complex subunit alpha-like UBA domain-containing protein n=1 Tax=Capronia coronata CBS 617.96 TaxID=1182541 RepID=W9YSU3_9EURO|nr:uncharacterized protein A1O1_01082 [Capronia coronata CBS 617.96]EXJ95957.1 hypothetical protein A1O1_01082 [Capronia coronata CBS 617.96]